MCVTPKSSWPWVNTQLHSHYEQPDPDAEHAQFERSCTRSRTKLLKVAAHLDQAWTDILALAALWREAWFNNPRNGCTGKSAGKPTWSGSSLAAPR